MLPGHVLLPRDKGGEVCDTRQREALPAVQPPAAFQSLPPRSEAGLLQLRPPAHVALWLPAGRTQLPDPRSACEHACREVHLVATECTRDRRLVDSAATLS